MNKRAIQSATNTQIKALQQQRDFVFNNLDPNVIGPLATNADIARAKARLALQGQIDPALLQQRYAAEAATSKTLNDIAAGNSPGDQVAAQAAKEALAGSGQLDAVKQKMIDEALTELNQGASLPPDVQAELVKAGLEKTGMVTGAASARGVGNRVVTQLIGREAEALRSERQRRAETLSSTAQQLTQSRANILQNLFPNLKQMQLSTLGAEQSALEQSNRLVPEAGLGGTDVANLWLARVGATNQLAQSAADAAARGAIAQGQNMANLAGNLSAAGAGSMNSWTRLSKLWGSNGTNEWSFSGTPTDLSGQEPGASGGDLVALGEPSPIE